MAAARRRRLERWRSAGARREVLAVCAAPSFSFVCTQSHRELTHSPCFVSARKQRAGVMNCCDERRLVSVVTRVEHPHRVFFTAFCSRFLPRFFLHRCWRQSAEQESSCFNAIWPGAWWQEFRSGLQNHWRGAKARFRAPYAKRQSTALRSVFFAPFARRLSSL